MIRVKFTYCFLGFICLHFFNASILAQTATSINWQFNLGKSGQTATYSTNGTSYFDSTWVSNGSNLNYKDFAINFGDTLTRFQPVNTNSTDTTSDINIISFHVSPATGLAFTPSSISFTCGKYGTSGGVIKVDWKSSDGTVTILKSKISPNRVDGGTAFSDISIDLSAITIPASSDDCSLNIYIYSLGNTKQAGLGNITVTGNVTETTARYDFNIAASPLAGGTVTSTPTGTRFNKGTSLIASASNNAGYRFFYWTSNGKDTLSKSKNYSFNITQNTNLTAVFKTSNTSSTNVTWNNPEPITYGTPLTNTQLNAIIAGSTGAVTYTPAIGTILNSGTQTITVTVEEDDNYDFASKSVTIEVYKAESTVTWPTPESITYETAISSTQLNATVTGTSGTADYSPTSGTVLPVGTQPLYVLFSADDNHCPAGFINSITINKALSAITWNNPADINYGTALSSTQLNATVTGTSGSATYSPASGTILDAGTHTLTVTFASDSFYKAVSKSVTINVKSVTAVKILTAENVSIYPNPTGSVVNIKIPVVESKLTITSSDGKTILVKDMSDTNYQVNMTNYPAGIYLFSISFKENKILKQIIKN